MVEGFDAAPIEAAGANAISTAGQPPTDAAERAQFRLSTGWGSYLDWMHASLDPRLCRVLLATPVRRIAWSGSGARVGTDAAEFRTRAVLVTLPVGWFRRRAGERRVRSRSSRLRRALAGLAMGDVVRIVRCFEPSGAPRTPRAGRAGFPGDPTFFARS
jgi:hypothetical protein